MDKKYIDMSYREFIENVLKIKLDEYQIQVLGMFEELKDKQYPLSNKRRKTSGIVDFIDNDKTKPTEPEIYIHQL